MKTFGPFTKRSRGNQPGVATGTQTYAEYDQGSAGFTTMREGTNRRLNKNTNARIVERYNAWPMDDGWHKNLFYNYCWVIRFRPTTLNPKKTFTEMISPNDRDFTAEFLGPNMLTAQGVPRAEIPEPMIDAKEFVPIANLPLLNYALMKHSLAAYNENRFLTLANVFDSFERLGACHISPAVEELWEDASGAPLIKNFTIEGPVDVHNYWGRDAKQNARVYWIYAPCIVDEDNTDAMTFTMSQDQLSGKKFAESVEPPVDRKKGMFMYWYCIPFVETVEISLMQKLEELKVEYIKGSETYVIRPGFHDVGRVMTEENAYHPSGITGIPLHLIVDPETLNHPLDKEASRNLAEITRRGTIRIFVDNLSMKHFTYYGSIPEAYDADAFQALNPFDRIINVR